jgi:hypothetical protein
MKIEQNEKRDRREKKEVRKIIIVMASRRKPNNELGWREPTCAETGD